MLRRRDTIRCPQCSQRRTLCFSGSESVPATHSLHHKSPLQDNAVKFKLYNGQFSLYLQSHTRARYDQSIHYLGHLIVFTFFRRSELLQSQVLSLSLLPRFLFSHLQSTLLRHRLMTSVKCSAMMIWHRSAATSGAEEWQVARS